jgi:hypothetical protein
MKVVEVDGDYLEMLSGRQFIKLAPYIPTDYADDDCREWIWNDSKLCSKQYSEYYTAEHSGYQESTGLVWTTGNISGKASKLECAKCNTTTQSQSQHCDRHLAFSWTKLRALGGAGARAINLSTHRRVPTGAHSEATCEPWAPPKSAAGASGGKGSVRRGVVCLPQLRGRAAGGRAGADSVLGPNPSTEPPPPPPLAGAYLYIYIYRAIYRNILCHGP